jgi:hypothetical protein
MSKQREIPQIQRGPRPNGKGKQTQVRLQPDLCTRIDTWAAKQDDKPSRPEAMRRLIEHALTLQPKALKGK